MSIRCRACKQLKNAELELADAQEVMRKQALEIAKLKTQVESMHAKTVVARDQVNKSVSEINRLSTELGKKSLEVIELKEELGK